VLKAAVRACLWLTAIRAGQRLREMEEDRYGCCPAASTSASRCSGVAVRPPFRQSRARRRALLLCTSSRPCMLCAGCRDSSQAALWASLVEGGESGALDREVGTRLFSRRRAEVFWPIRVSAPARRGCRTKARGRGGGEVVATIAQPCCLCSSGRRRRPAGRWPPGPSFRLLRRLSGACGASVGCGWR